MDKTLATLKAEAAPHWLKILGFARWGDSEFTERMAVKLSVPLAIGVDGTLCVVDLGVSPYLA